MNSPADMGFYWGIRYRLTYDDASAIFVSKGMPDFSTPYANCNNLRMAAQTPTFSLTPALLE